MHNGRGYFCFIVYHSIHLYIKYSRKGGCLFNCTFFPCSTGLLVWKAFSCKWDVLCYNSGSNNCWSSTFPISICYLWFALYTKL